MLSTRLFGKTTDLKLKAITIIHSSTTETVRLPPDCDGTNVVVHPTAVRSKLPAKRRVREANHRRRLKEAARKKAKATTETAKSSDKENSATPSPRKVQKKVIAKKKKPVKTTLKKKKEVIDYSAAQEKSSGKTPDEDPLGKVRNWLLNSHNITGSLAVRKSKSSPAGFLQTENQQRSPAKVHRPQTRTTEQRGKSGSLDAQGKEQVKLQVVYKPPFKFSVKLKKPTEVATTVVKEINSKVNQRGRKALLIKSEHDPKHKQNRKSRPVSGEAVSPTTPKVEAVDNVDSCAKEITTPVENKDKIARLISVDKNEPLYENSPPIYENTHDLSIPSQNCPKVDLLRMSSVECVTQSKIPLDPDRTKTYKITRHHSVDGKNQGNILVREDDKRRRRDSCRDSRKRYSLATDKYMGSCKPVDKPQKVSGTVEPVTRLSVPLLDSDVDSNLLTVPSDLEVLLSESEYLFSDDA